MRHLDPPPSPPGRRAALVALSFLVLLAAPPMAWSASHTHARHTHDFEWCSNDGDGFRWAVIDGKSKVMGDRSDDDVRAALVKEARASGRRVLWLRLDGEDWVVRDRALVDRADELLRPMRELGGKMGALGGEMGRHGAEVGRLAAKQAAVDVRLALAGWDDDEDALTDRERHELQRKSLELKRERDRMEGSRARVESRELGERMEGLGRRMEQMGERMRVAAARAEREMRALAREAIQQRKAARFGDAA
jgi:hypothetical protein